MASIRTAFTGNECAISTSANPDNANVQIEISHKSTRQKKKQQHKTPKRKSLIILWSCIESTNYKYLFDFP